MSALTIQRTQWTSQPKCPVAIGGGSSLNEGLVYSAFNTQMDYASIPRNYVGRGGAAGLSVAPAYLTGALGASTSFNGSTSYKRFDELSLVPYTRSTFTWWMWWDAYANNDHCGWSYDGAGGWGDHGIICNPNESSTGNFMIGVSGTSQSNTAFDFYTRPTAAAWHFYSVIVDRLAASQPVLEFRIDNIVASIIGGSVTWTPQPWGANFLTFGAINGGSSVTLFGASRIQHFNIWGRALSSGELTSMYRNSAQILNPLRSLRYGPAAAGTVSSHWFLTH